MEDFKMGAKVNLMRTELLNLQIYQNLLSYNNVWGYIANGPSYNTNPVNR